MRGFTDKALIVCPKIATYDARNLDYQVKLLDSIKNFVAHLRNCGIKPYFIFTDELSHELPVPDMHWVSPLTAGDVFFIKNNVDGFDTAKEPEYLFTSQIEDIAKKFKIERGLEREVRFEQVLKREVRGVKVLMENFNCIAVFHHPRNPSFKIPQSVEGDGKLIITVDHVAFLAQGMLGGVQVPIDSFLQLECATTPVFRWVIE